MAYKKTIDAKIRAYIKYHGKMFTPHSKVDTVNVKDIAKKCQISLASVYRLMKEPLHKVTISGSRKFQIFFFLWFTLLFYFPLFFCWLGQTLIGIDFENVWKKKLRRNLRCVRKNKNHRRSTRFIWFLLREKCSSYYINIFCVNVLQKHLQILIKHKIITGNHV